MNDGLKCGLFLVAGMALGALSVVALSKGKLDFRPVASDLISRGLDVKDALAGKLEAMKEDLEDIAAAARQKSDKRKTEAAGEKA
ncbi:MAG: hypothetical protein J5846_06695 [Desulfovibrio sp.]|nr:hypothetical protein [Desulfovibrio sp.]